MQARDNIDFFFGPAGNRTRELKDGDTLKTGVQTIEQSK